MAEKEKLGMWDTHWCGRGTLRQPWKSGVFEVILSGHAADLTIRTYSLESRWFNSHSFKDSDSHHLLAEVVSNCIHWSKSLTAAQARTSPGGVERAQTVVVVGSSQAQEAPDLASGPMITGVDSGVN